MLKQTQSAIPYEYFPTPHQAVVFRNWGCVSADRLAKVLGATPDRIRDCAREMGLDPMREADPRWLDRGYITLIRQNWHLLNEEQLLALLDWDAEKLDFTLREDDFLYVKLGMTKPICPHVAYRALTEAERQKTAWLRKIVERAPGIGAEKPFAFLDSLARPETLARRNARPVRENEIALDADWGIDNADFPEDAAFAVERFRRRIQERWGVTLAGSRYMIRLARMEKAGALRETHTLSLRAGGICVRSVDAAGAMRALTELEAMFEQNGACAFLPGETHRTPRFETRILYPYAAVYGDVFLDEANDPLPEGLLDRLMQAGVNGIWLHQVLYKMTPFPFDPALSEGWETRLATLNRFVERAARYGIRIYLYVNEPRALPSAFFDAHPELAGHTADDLTCLCTSRPEVIAYLRNGMRLLFERAPGLGGAFVISMSENWTHCFARDTVTNCPRCKGRSIPEVSGEVCRAIAEGVHAANPDADVFLWNWAWGQERGFWPEDAEATVGMLPSDCWMQATSESDMPFSIGGVEGRVRDYSMSLPGPGDMARAYWRAGRAHGMRCAAKIQVNCTWECAAAPYLPVLDLVREHMDNLAKEHVTGLFLSWTLGGYPSENLRRLSRYFWLEQEETQSPAPAERAQTLFSQAFRNFPFSIDTLYFAPQNMGPANPLLAKRSGWDASMVGFPYDDLKTWRNIYPESVFEAQFDKLADQWDAGVRYLEAHAPEETELLNISRALGNHFRSVALQCRYVRLRDGNGDRGALRQTVLRQRDVIVDQISRAGADARIGYEASNHYFYTRQTLLEALLACEAILQNDPQR